MMIPYNLHITLAQVDPVWENPERNRRNLEGPIMDLSGISDLVILPETFSTGFSMRTPRNAEAMDGPTIQWMERLSRESGVAIAGSLLIRERSSYFNRFIFITPAGELSFYDKRHLFSIGNESDLLKPGDQQQIVQFRGWKIALFICYDIRFPVWCRNTADADLMIFTANWPDSRQEVWNTLLKARAIENQSYVAGVNRIGTDGEGIFYSGGSQMINARGEPMQTTSLRSGGLFSYKISRAELHDFRKKFPVGKDADRFKILDREIGPTLK